MIGRECHEEVSRRGEAQPCDKPAVAMRIDPTEGNPYPVCAHHARADMVPLADLIIRHHAIAWDEGWRASAHADLRPDANPYRRLFVPITIDYRGRGA